MDRFSREVFCESDEDAKMNWTKIKGKFIQIKIKFQPSNLSLLADDRLLWVLVDFEQDGL